MEVVYPGTNIKFYTDPTYYWYRNNFLELLNNSESILYNCTGSGILFGDKIEVELFKYPEDFKNYLENNTPKIVCFTNYSWTLDISNEFSKILKKQFSNFLSLEQISHPLQ